MWLPLSHSCFWSLLNSRKTQPETFLRTRTVLHDQQFIHVNMVLCLTKIKKKKLQFTIWDLVTSIFRLNYFLHSGAMRTTLNCFSWILEQLRVLLSLCQFQLFICIIRCPKPWLRLYVSLASNAMATYHRIKQSCQSEFFVRLTKISSISRSPESLANLTKI